MTVLTETDLAEIHETSGPAVRCLCRFTSTYVGGSPAERKGVEAFVAHKLKLIGPEAEKAVARILSEEIGERVDSTGDPDDEGELDKREAYNVNVLRADPVDGCRYVASWQIKAAIKVALSRIGLYVKKKGSKGDTAEAGEVYACGISVPTGEPMPTTDEWMGEYDAERFARAEDPGYAAPHKRCRIIDAWGGPYLGNRFKRLHGHVQTPQGSRSIVTDHECAPVGCQFEFIYRFRGSRITEDNVKEAFALLRIIGVGSSRSLGHGQFAIERMEIIDNDKLGPRAPKKKVEDAKVDAA